MQLTNLILWANNGSWNTSWKNTILKCLNSRGKVHSEVQDEIKDKKGGCAWGLTPVIPALFWRPRWADCLRLGVWDQPDQHGEMQSLLKIQKISQAWWCVPVIPAPREDEAGESLESGRQRLQWVETLPIALQPGIFLVSRSLHASMIIFLPRLAPFGI